MLQKGNNSTQIVRKEPRKDLTREAQRARDSLRWAESLQRKKLQGERQFNREEQALLRELDAGKLRAAANDATRKSGWGRIKHEDGTYEDIAPHNGGIVRTVLDNVVPMSDEEEFCSTCSCRYCCCDMNRVA